MKGEPLKKPPPLLLPPAKLKTSVYSKPNSFKGKEKSLEERAVHKFTAKYDSYHGKSIQMLMPVIMLESLWEVFDRCGFFSLALDDKFIGGELKGVIIKKYLTWAFREVKMVCDLDDEKFLVVDLSRDRLVEKFSSACCNFIVWGFFLWSWYAKTFIYDTFNDFCNDFLTCVRSGHARKWSIIRKLKYDLLMICDGK